jgi:hypothetical protein
MNLHGAETDHDEYHNPLFHIDDAGYIHIRDLSTYSKKMIMILQLEF